MSTPIGNLEDITLRALRVLREAELVAAEDTRRTARLLQHYSISTRTTSLHEHNERQKIPALLARLQAGARLALVSDAGTPTVSDPGARFIAAVLDAGLRVEPIPGPSAILAALVASGFPSGPFVFSGFPPTRSKDRKEFFSALALESRVIVIFEAPHRVLATLRELRAILGERQISVCRELTKAHEKLVKGPISGVVSRLPQPRGEYTLVIGPAEPLSSPAVISVSDAGLANEFGLMTEDGMASRREAIRTLAAKYGVRQREIFLALERAKKSVE